MSISTFFNGMSHRKSTKPRCIRHHFEVFERFGSDAFEADPWVGRVFDLESTVMRHKGTKVPFLCLKCYTC